MAVGDAGATAAARVGHGDGLDGGRRAARRLGGERLRADEDDVRAAGGERGLHVGRAAEDRLGGDEAVAVDLEVDVVGEHRRSSLTDRRPATSRPS